MRFFVLFFFLEKRLCGCGKTILLHFRPLFWASLRPTYFHFLTTKEIKFKKMKHPEKMWKKLMRSNPIFKSYAPGKLTHTFFVFVLVFVGFFFSFVCFLFLCCCCCCCCFGLGKTIPKKYCVSKKVEYKFLSVNLRYMSMNLRYNEQ